MRLRIIRNMFIAIVDPLCKQKLVEVRLEAWVSTIRLRANAADFPRVFVALSGYVRRV